MTFEEFCFKFDYCEEDSYIKLRYEFFKLDLISMNFFTIPRRIITALHKASYR